MTDGTTRRVGDTRGAEAPWDRQVEGYLRDRGIRLAAVVCPVTVAVPAGLVHLLDASQADLVRGILADHPDIASVEPSENVTTLVYFTVKVDADGQDP